jgi:uncharacterized protein YbaP (TraB family)
MNAMCLAKSLVLLLVLTPAVSADGLVYRISGPGISTSYLVGTLHSDDPRVMARVEQLKPLLDRVDTVAVEILPDGLSMVAATAATLLPSGERLRDLVGGKRFDSIGTMAAERGLPAGLLDRMKPWAAAVTLGMPSTGGGQFLDSEIYLEGLARNLKLVGLESVSEQLAVFEEMSLEHQILMLDEVIKNADRLSQQLEELVVVYLQGDLEQLDRLARQQFREMPFELQQWFEQTLINNRNVRMRDRMLGLLEKQAVLVAVGALHLSGDRGLIALLRQDGYSVTRHR